MRLILKTTLKKIILKLSSNYSKKSLHYRHCPLIGINLEIGRHTIDELLRLLTNVNNLTIRFLVMVKLDFTGNFAWNFSVRSDRNNSPLNFGSNDI
jgi:hypothetical protein